MNYTEALNQYERTRRALAFAGENEDAARRRLHGALDELRRNRCQETHDTFTQARDELARLEDVRRRAQIASTYAEDTARGALLRDLRTKAAEFLRRYDGRPYGPKTSQRIASEFYNASGFYLYLRQEYRPGVIFRTYDAGSPWSYQALELTGSPSVAILDDRNRIAAGVVSELIPYHEYRETDDPERSAAELLAAWDAARDAYAAWKRAADNYNDLKPSGGVEDISIFSGPPSRICP